jgi:hypothetical protein
MDRLSWYQAGETMEEILRQAAHVGIYDGDLKQVSYDIFLQTLHNRFFSLHLNRELYHLLFNVLFGQIVLIRIVVLFFITLSLKK